MTESKTNMEVNSLIKESTKNPKNNKKGIRLVVTNLGKGVFSKTEVTRQYITIGLSLDIETNHFEVLEPRTIIHNKIQDK